MTSIPSSAPAPAVTSPAATAFGLAYLVLALLGHRLSLGDAAPIATFWPAAGLYVAALALSRVGRWPMLVTAAAAANLVTDAVLLGRPAALVASLALANAAEALVAATVLRATLGERDVRIDAPRAATGMLLAAASAPVVGASIAATVAASALAGSTFAGWRADWLEWWSADMLGIVLVAPMLFALRGAPSLSRTPTDGRRLAAAAASMAVLAAAAAWSFSRPPGGTPLSYLPLPVLLWVCVRFGPAGAAVGSLTLALIAVAGTGAGTGPFAVAGLDAASQALGLKLYLGASVATAHAIVALAGDRQQARDATSTLAGSERYLRSVLESSPDCLKLVELDGTLSYMNANGRGQMEIAPPDEAIGREWAAMWPPATRERVRAAVRAASAGRTDRFEGMCPTAGGTPRWWDVAVAPVLDTEGRIVRIVGMSRDVTGQRAMRAELQALNATLETRVRDEVEAREHAQRRARHAERVQALGQLAGGIAHDFNNVLQSIQGAARVLERRPEDAALVRRFTRILLDATARGAGITRRLLAFARRDELHAEPVEAGLLLDGLCEILTHTLGSRIEVRCELDRDVPAMLADRSQLETVMVNLAINGRDAMPDGGTLTLRVGVAEPDAALRARLGAGRHVRLDVTDTGTGIEPELLERVVEPFFTTKPTGRGTGLGLSIARGFAEQSGGALTIDSAPGLGTTVSLWLPVADGPLARPPDAPAQPRRARPAPLASEDAPRPAVLLVDDDPLVRETLEATLVDEGFAVRAAASGEEALASVDAGLPVDVLVTDLSMPGIDGLTLIRRLRERRRGLPAVLVTGYADDAVGLALGEADLQRVVLVRKPASARRISDELALLL